MNNLIVASIQARLKGLPIIITHPCDDMVYIYADLAAFDNVKQFPTSNRWDHIGLRINGSQLVVNTITVAFYIDLSTFNESAVVYHLFHKCMNKLGELCGPPPPVEKWAYVSTKRVERQIRKREVKAITAEYVEFLKVCQQTYKWRSLRWGRHWRDVTARKLKLVRRQVWDHWMERALRPADGALFKLYERRFVRGAGPHGKN